MLITFTLTVNRIFRLCTSALGSPTPHNVRPQVPNHARIVILNTKSLLCSNSQYSFARIASHCLFVCKGFDRMT